MTERPASIVAAPDATEAAADLGRAEAFRRLTDRHLDASYRLARAILTEPVDAEDAVQDALIQAWRKWSTLRDPAHFEHWFDRIVVNVCRNRLRHRARTQTRDLAGALALAAPGDAFATSRDRDELGSALATLDPDQRVVVALRFYAEMTIDEIADRLGVPSGTVKSRLHYALRRLHHTLDEADSREALR